LTFIKAAALGRSTLEAIRTFDFLAALLHKNKSGSAAAATVDCKGAQPAAVVGGMETTGF
jgi:hypothetical protein